MNSFSLKKFMTIMVVTTLIMIALAVLFLQAGL